jgi:hypothetical protein
MAQAGFRKILITLGHVYSPSPWLQYYNINKYGNFGAQVPSCQGNTTPINIGGAWIANWGSLNQCQKDWIKAEYQRLAQKFMAVAEQAVPGGLSSWFSKSSMRQVRRHGRRIRSWFRPWSRRVCRRPGFRSTSTRL